MNTELRAVLTRGMPSAAQLRTVSAQLDSLSSAHTGGASKAGWWSRIAAAAEEIAGSATTATNNVAGYMLRTAIALELVTGASPSGYNRNHDGLLTRIVNALETASSVGAGSLSNRFAVAGAVFTAGPRIELTNASVSEAATAGTAVGTLSVVNGTGSWTFTEIAPTAANLAVASGGAVTTVGTLAAGTQALAVQATNGTDTITRSFTITFEALTTAPAYRAGATPAGTGETATAQFHILHDDISLDQFGLSDGLTLAGDGTGALTDNPDASHHRGKLMRLRTAGGAGDAYFAERIRSIPVGGHGGNILNTYTAMSTFYFGMHFVPVAGEALIFVGYANNTATGTEVYRVGIKDMGGGKFRFVLGSETRGADHDYGVLHEMRTGSNGIGGHIIQARAAGGSWTTLYTGSGVTLASPIMSFRWGCIGATKATDIYVAQTSLSDLGFTEMERDLLAYCSGTRDITSDSFAAVAWVPTGMFRAQNKVRLRWAAGPDPTSGTTTAATALTSASNNVIPFTVSGRTAGAQHSWQYQVMTAADAVVYTSPVFKCRTFPAAGSSAAVEWAHGSCNYATPLFKPQRHLQWLLTQATGSSFYFVKHLGDFGYESGNGAGAAQGWTPYIDNHPPSTQPEFERNTRDHFTDYDQIALQEAVACIYQQDDHQMANNFAAAERKDTRDWSAWTDYTGPGTYPSGTTIADIWQNGAKVCNDWFNSMRAGKPADDFPGDTPVEAIYRYREAGQVAFVELDTHFTRTLTGTPKQISDQQYTWMVDKITNRHAGIELIVPIMQSDLTSFTDKETESWQGVAVAQYRSFVNYMAGLPLLWMVDVADDHVGFAVNLFATTSLNPTTPANFLGEVLQAGLGVMYRQQAKYTLYGNPAWRMDPSSFTVNKPMRVSYMVTKVAADIATVDLSIEDNGTVRTHRLYTDATDTTAPTITSTNTVSVAENATLSHALTANETVTWTITGGADQADFELSGSTLRWVGNTTRDYESPADADTNNAYVVQVTATDTSPALNASNQTITVTVTDVAEGGGYTFTHAEAATLVAARTDSPDDTHKADIDTLVGALKTAGMFSWDLLYVMIAGDDASTRLNYANPAANALTGSATFTSGQGLTGNGANLLSTGLNANAGTNFGATSGTLFVWVAAAGGTVGSTIGTATGATLRVNPRGSGGTATSNYNTTDNIAPTVASAVGLTALTRSGGTVKIYRNGALLATDSSITNSAPGAVDLTVLGANGTFPTHRVIAAGFGAYGDDTAQTALYDALNAYFTARGVT